LDFDDATKTDGLSPGREESENVPMIDPAQGPDIDVIPAVVLSGLTFEGDDLSADDTFVIEQILDQIPGFNGIR
jgi:hypothetical protein